MPDDLKPLVERLRQPWFTHGCEQYQLEAADRIEGLETALSKMAMVLEDIATEAERENGSWVHLKRVIGINARKALTAYRNRTEHVT